MFSYNYLSENWSFLNDLRTEGRYPLQYSYSDDSDESDSNQASGIGFNFCVPCVIVNTHGVGGQTAKY